MAVLDIHLLGSPVLRERAAEIAVVDDALRAFIDDMFETMNVACGVGLAANQVGSTQRVAIIDAEGQTFAMINPRIVAATGKESKEEGCLSIPEVYAEVVRPDSVILEALNEKGEPFRLEATGLVARAIQHEIDHLDGILFIDHLSPLKRQMLVKRWKKENGGELTRTPRPEEESEKAG
ncbi:MAG: peptide deformylase [Gemmatimonadales bacterium]|nr:peptide deformylase [Gemmatimonadales bacterium]MBP6570809.1 peptide deformylase [Gemmatimonadales bacterium]MBP7620297.1 peptide deformylase [Gemmatimonadales bacterium]